MFSRDLIAFIFLLVLSIPPYIKFSEYLGQLSWNTSGERHSSYAYNTNIYPIYDLLECTKGPVLQIQSYSIFL